MHVKKHLAQDLTHSDAKKLPVIEHVLCARNRILSVLHVLYILKTLILTTRS